MSLAAALLAGASGWIGPAPAFAQGAPLQGLQDSRPTETRTTETRPAETRPPEGAAPETRTLALEAAFPKASKPIRSGLVWRVFRQDDAASDPVPAATSRLATPTLTLPPGTYLVHASYGFATASKRVTLGATGASERLLVAAGALKLGGAIGDVPIPPGKLSFAVYLPVGSDMEGRLVAANLKSGDVVRLPEGSYHVVSTYGESNAIMRVDLKVEAGQMTEATVNHRAALLTLKLVATAGGEAFAGTSFSVLTPGGDVIREVIGAFPTVTLAEGEYVLIARHDGTVYTRDFKVESGLDRDIEVSVKGN